MVCGRRIRLRSTIHHHGRAFRQRDRWKWSMTGFGVIGMVRALDVGPRRPRSVWSWHVVRLGVLPSRRCLYASIPLIRASSGARAAIACRRGGDRSEVDVQPESTHRRETASALACARSVTAAAAAAASHVTPALADVPASSTEHFEIVVHFRLDRSELLVFALRTDRRHPRRILSLVVSCTGGVGTLAAQTRVHKLPKARANLLLCRKNDK